MDEPVDPIEFWRSAAHAHRLKAWEMDVRLQALEERVGWITQIIKDNGYIETAQARSLKGDEADAGVGADVESRNHDVAEPRSVEECNCFDVLGHRLTESIGYAYFPPCPIHGTPGPSDSQPDNTIVGDTIDQPISGLTPDRSDDTQDGLDRTQSWLEQAYRRGRARCEYSDEKGSAHRFDYRPTPEQAAHTHGMAAASELLVARTLGREWLASGLDADDGVDVAGSVSVRWTPLPKGSLILHPGDMARYSVLVTGNRLDKLEIVGYIVTSRGQVSDYWRDDVRHAAFFVPQEALSPIENLMEGGCG